MLDPSTDVEIKMLKLHNLSYFARVLLATVAGVAFANAGHGSSFTGLGTTPDGLYRAAKATRVSANGSVVVGFSKSGIKTQAFRWTRTSGMTLLGDFPGGAENSQTYGLSSDGSVLVGTGCAQTKYLAFSWTEASGMVDLPGWDANLPFIAYGASANGRVVVGVAFSNALTQGLEAFRQVDGSIVGLGGLDGSASSLATDVSADGSVVVGRNKSGADYRWEAFIWTEANGMTGLGSLPGEFESNATAVSSDGTTVVGSTAMYSINSKGFYWTAADGMLPLESADPDIIDGSANDVSGDGSIIVGKIRSATKGPIGAFIWTKEAGMRNLVDVLAEQGVNLSGWTLIEALGVSDDGLTIVGGGTNPFGAQEAWIAEISPLAPACGDVDYDNDGTGDECDEDDDGDGVMDVADLCPLTDLGEFVDSNGCSISQLMDSACPCDSAWKNHGQFVSCAAKKAEKLVEDGLLTLEEKDQLVSAYAESDCAKR